MGQYMAKMAVIDDEPAVGIALRRALSPEHEVHLPADAKDLIGRIERGERFDIAFCRTRDGDRSR